MVQGRNTGNEDQTHTTSSGGGCLDNVVLHRSKLVSESGNLDRCSADTLEDSETEEGTEQIGAEEPTSFQTCFKSLAQTWTSSDETESEHTKIQVGSVNESTESATEDDGTNSENVLFDRLVRVDRERGIWVKNLNLFMRCFLRSRHVDCIVMDVTLLLVDFRADIIARLSELHIVELASARIGGHLGLLLSHVL